MIRYNVYGYLVADHRLILLQPNHAIITAFSRLSWSFDWVGAFHSTLLLSLRSICDLWSRTDTDIIALKKIRILRIHRNSPRIDIRT